MMENANQSSGFFRNDVYRLGEILNIPEELVVTMALFVTSMKHCVFF